jgi:hypothetical protein
MFYSPSNKRISFNEYGGMFILNCPPKPSQAEGWEYAFVPEEQGYLLKTCNVKYFQDIRKAAQRTFVKDKDIPNLRVELKRYFP